MADPASDLQRLSPDKLVAGFARTKVFQCLLIAIAAHLVLAAATSVAYVRDRWIDPEGAAKRAAEKLAAQRAEEAEPAAPRAMAPKGARPATHAAAKPTTASAKAPDDPEMTRRKGSRVVDNITKAAKKDEIPKAPDDLGIPIEDTTP